MAFLMSYTDERNTPHPESVWLPIFVSFDHTSLSGRITFNGYHDLNSLALNVPPIGQKSYPVSGDAYLSVVGQAPTEQATLLDVVSAGCYSVALSTLDVAAPTELDPDNKVSFFADATQFDLPV